MIAVATKEYTIAGIDEVLVSFAAFWAVCAAQIKPPTSASVCAGARMDVSIGCQAVFAVLNKFHPKPSGSESEARIYEAFVRTKERLNATQNINPNGIRLVEREAKRSLSGLLLLIGKMPRVKMPGRRTKIIDRNVIA